MRFVPTGPGRVSAPYLEAGDSVSLATRHGEPCGKWQLITRGQTEVELEVPNDVGPVNRWLAKDARGRIQWWSDPAWWPSLHAGAVATPPISPPPTAERSRPRAVPDAVPDAS